MAKNIRRKTSFKTLPKTMRWKVPSKYRPIATMRLFYMFFAYMILGPVETQLENQAGLSGQQSCGRTFGDYTFGIVQKPGLVKGLRPSTLASTMVGAFRTRPFRTHDLDDSKPPSRPTWASCWQQWLQQTLCHAIHGGVRQGCGLSSPALLFCVGTVNGDLA